MKIAYFAKAYCIHPAIMKKFTTIVLSLMLTLSAYSQSVISFDGVNDYINLGSNAGNNVRSVEFWFKLDNRITSNITSTKMICGREVSSANTNEWHISFTQSGANSPAGHLRFAVVSSVGNAKDVISNNSSWNANQWYHVAAVIDPVQGMMLFIDGIKQNDTEPSLTSPTPVMNYDFELGRFRGFSNRYFEGDLDDFHLSSTALYTSNFSPPCPDRSPVAGTKGLWNFNEQSGLVAVDSSSTQNNVTISGASWDTSTVCHKAQASLAFDGQNDYINLGANAGNNVRTVEFWFKLNQAVDSTNTKFMVLCGREVGSTNINEWNIVFIPGGTRQNAPGKLRFGVIHSVGNLDEVFSNSNTWNANQWYHFAGVIHPTQGMMMFIDGVKQSSTKASYTSATPAMTQDFEIGRLRTFSNRYFEGNIEDFHLSTSALYTANFTPPCPGRTPGTGTIGLWNFNENAGTTAHDAGPLQNDVFINGATWDSSFVCQGQTVGIEEIETQLVATEELEVYPNPSEGVLYISSKEQLSRVSIYDLNGKLIEEFRQMEQNRIELPEQKGFYLLRIQTESGEMIQKKVIRN